MKKLFSRNKKQHDVSLSKNSANTNASKEESHGHLTNGNKMPPLHKAVYSTNIQKIVSNKNVDSLDSENRTALHIACSLGYSNIVQELLEMRARTNMADNNHETPLMTAAQSGNVECIQLLCKSGCQMNSRNKQGNTAVHLACISNQKKALDTLFNAGASLDIQNYNGETALHIVSEKNNIDLATWLLENGADGNLQNKDGHTVLMRACNSGNTDFASLCLDHHVDTLLVDADNLSAVDHAKNKLNDKCLELVIKYQELYGLTLNSHKMKNGENGDTSTATALNESWNSSSSESENKVKEKKNPHLKHFLYSLENDPDRDRSAAGSVTKVPLLGEDIHDKGGTLPSMLSARTEAPDMPEDLIIDSNDWNDSLLPMNTNQKIFVPAKTITSDVEESDGWDSDLESLKPKKSHSSKMDSSKSDWSGTPRAAGGNAGHSFAESSAWDSTAKSMDDKTIPLTQNSQNQQSVPVTNNLSVDNKKEDLVDKEENWDSSEFEDEEEQPVSAAGLDKEQIKHLPNLSRKGKLIEISTSPIIPDANLDWSKTVDAEDANDESSLLFQEANQKLQKDIREEKLQAQKRYKEKLDFDDETILKNEQNLQERMKMKMNKLNNDELLENEDQIQPATVSAVQSSKPQSFVVDPGFTSSDDDLLKEDDPRVRREKEYEEKINQLRVELDEVKESLAKERRNKVATEAERRQMESLKSDLQSRLNKALTDHHLSEQTRVELEEKLKSKEHDLTTERNERISYENQMKQTTDKLMTKEDECFQTLQELQKRERELRNLQLEQKGSQHVIKKLEVEKKELKNRVDEVTSRASLDSLTNSEVKLKQPLLIDSRSDTCLKEELARLEEENKMLERCLQQVKNDEDLHKEALEQALLHCNVQINNLQSELDEMKKDEVARSDIKEDEIEEIKHLRKQLEDSQNILLEMQNSQAQSEKLVHENLATWTHKLHLPHREIQQLRDNNRKLIAHVTKAENKLAKVELELANGTLQLDQKSKELRRLKKDLEHKNLESADYKERIEIIEAENQELAEKLESVENKLSEVNKQSALLHHHLDLLVKNLERKCDLSQEDLEKLKEIKMYAKQFDRDNIPSLPDLRDELDRSASVVHQLQQELKSLKAEYRQARDTISRLESENSQITAANSISPVVNLNVRSSGEGRPSSARSGSQLNDILDKLNDVEKSVQTDKEKLAALNDDEIDKLKSRCAQLESEKEALVQQNRYKSENGDVRRSPMNYLDPLQVNIHPIVTPHVATQLTPHERFDFPDEINSPNLIRHKSASSVSRSHHSAGSDILLEKLKVELNRSIAKHLEAGVADQRSKRKGSDMFHGTNVEGDNSYHRDSDCVKPSDIDVSYTSFLRRKYLL